jgi:hypothetical protein
MSEWLYGNNYNNQESEANSNEGRNSTQIGTYRHSTCGQVHIINCQLCSLIYCSNFPERIMLIYFSFNSRALMATITVLKLISTAPKAGLSVKCGYSAPAAKGIATTL